MNLLKAAGAVSVMTLLSRITGLAREAISFIFFGADALQDAFREAWQVLNLLQHIIAGEEA
jgi:putative peptidoglycan lipid II flippase